MIEECIVVIDSNSDCKMSHLDKTVILGQLLLSLDIETLWYENELFWWNSGSLCLKCESLWWESDHCDGTVNHNLNTINHFDEKVEHCDGMVDHLDRR